MDKVPLSNVPSAQAVVTGDLSQEPTRQVEAVVFAVILEFNQARVRTDDGSTYALTRRTPGVSLEDLYEGQRLVLTVNSRWPLVLAAIPADMSHEAS
jgi:hypothetical protein